jgi:hypothetical protein
MDRRWPDDFKTERIRGYAAAHSLTLKLNCESKVKVQSQSPAAVDRLDRLRLVER